MKKPSTSDSDQLQAVLGGNGLPLTPREARIKLLYEGKEILLDLEREVPAELRLVLGGILAAHFANEGSSLDKLSGLRQYGGSHNTVWVALRRLIARKLLSSR